MTLSQLAPGTYVRSQTRPVLGSATPILSLRNNYILVEVKESASIDPNVGLPYNLPFYIYSLEDYQNRIGGVPTSGPELISYNEVKQAFRGSPANTPIFVIRVKSVAGIKIDLLRPVEFATPEGPVYGYPLVVNGYKVGQVNYDENNVETHYGVLVQSSVTVTDATQIVIDAINSDPVLRQDVRAQSNIYVRISMNSIELYPRTYGSELDAYFAIPANTPIEQGGVITVINPNDEIAETTRPRIEPRDYIHTIETAFDPEINQPGFITAGAAYFKFKPVDRLAVFLSAQALVSRAEFEWVHLVSSGPTDGNAIAQHYGYRYFDILDSELTSTGILGDRIQDVVFVKETNEFYRLQNSANGLPQDTVSVENINLPYKFTTVTQVRPNSNLLTPGMVISNVARTEVYGVIDNFNISRLNWPLTNGQITTAVAANHLVGPLKLLVHNSPSNVPSSSRLEVSLTDIQAAATTDFSFTLTVNGTIYNFNMGNETFTDVEDLVSKMRSKFLSDGTGIYYVLSISVTPNTGFTLTNIDSGVFSSTLLLSDGDPIGNLNYVLGVVPTGLPYLFAGQLIESNETVYFVKRYFRSLSLNLPQNVQQQNLVLDIPTAFYDKWVSYNINLGRISVAAYNPDTDLAFGRFSGVFSGQRSIKYNLTSNRDFIPERLMYDSPLGHSFYTYPAVIDLEQFEVPAAQFVAGVYFTKSFTEGFQIAPAGTGWPLQVLGTAVTIKKADQDITNQLGMNAIRRVNNSIVVYGARTLSSNQLFNETNTRFLMSSIIQSARHLFDGYVFTLNDALLTYSEVQGIATGFLNGYYNLGSFEGASPETAFQAICNASNNSAQDRLEKNIIVEAWVIPRGLTERVFFNINVAARGTLPRVGTS